MTLDWTGNHYTGTFSSVQYAVDEKTVIPPVIQGVVTATRITVD